MAAQSALVGQRGELDALVSACAAELRTRWEAQLQSGVTEQQQLGWLMLSVYPRLALEEAAARTELSRIAALAEQLGNQPQADPNWRERAAITRARTMAPGCKPDDVQAALEYQKGVRSFHAPIDLELANELARCAKSLPDSDPLAIESAAKAAVVHSFFGHRSDDPARKKELLALALAESTFVIERRHQYFPRATQPKAVLWVHVQSLSLLGRQPEARQRLEELLADEKLLTARPDVRQPLEELRFDFLWEVAGELDSKERYGECAQAFSELTHHVPKSYASRLVEVYYNIGSCYETAGDSKQADKAWHEMARIAPKDSQLVRAVEQRKAARTQRSSP